MERNNQVTRILKLIKILETHPRGLTVPQILEKMSDDGITVSRDTIYRDLHAIQGTGAPLINDDPDRPGVWRMEFIASLTPNINFTARDLISLFLAQSSIEHLKGSVVYEEIKTFFNKLKVLLKVRDFDALEEYANIYGFKYRSTWQTGVSGEILDTVHAACAERQLLKIDYKSVTGDSKGIFVERVVGPEKIFFADSNFYLVAVDQKDQKLKTYSLSRVRHAEMLDEVYHSKKSVKLDEYFKESFGILNMGEPVDVEIFISEPMASYVTERRWHDSQQVIRHKDGILFKMRVKENDELVRWVLSLAPHVEIIKPLSLQTKVINFLENCLERIRNKKEVA
jgi:predicted DNA-binding transcriptional regulator YafY